MTVWYRSILSLQHSTFLSLTFTILDGKSQKQNPGLVFKDGEWWDEVSMAILEKDWKEGHIKMEK
jgi:hypothetical protein